MSPREESISSRRGLFIWGILGSTCLLAAGGIIAFFIPASERSPGLGPIDRLARARDAYSYQNCARAEEWLEPLVKDGHGSLGERLFYGQILLDLGRLQKARDLFNALHKENPDSAEVVAGLGQVHERSGELDLAISCYKRASDMKKTDARFFRLLGIAQEERGDRMAALFSFRQSLKLLPGQEDLSKRMSEIGAARTARMDPSQSTRNRSFDPFDDFNPHPADPREMGPGTGVPDPFQGIPRPGGRMR
jgi:Flp pilus assembly protein TadD